MDRDSEKAGVEHLPKADGSHAGSDGAFPLDTVTEAERRRIMRRVDRRLVATVGALYCVSLMDRTNLSAAAIAGMLQELALIGNRYSVITLVFFVTYIVFQPPSTIIVRKLGPRIHLAAITLLWGALMIGMGFVKTWEQMAAMRVLLGVLEAGFFPSCIYLLSTWYTRYEVGKRYSVFYIVGCVASAFAGILAYGLMQLHGKANLTGWRWIFIIEGIITCVLAIASYWLLIDFPDSTRATWSFLSDREKAFVMARVDADRGDVKITPYSHSAFLGSALDWKVWGYALIFFGTTTVTYSLAYFLPIILNVNLGFDVGASQCLVAPPYAFAGLIMYLTGWLGDKYHIRGPIIIGNMVLCIIGLSIMGWHSKPAVRYFGIFLTTAGANSNIPAAMSFQANNIRGQWKRAFCSATLVGLGGVGGIAGSLVFRSQDAPAYQPGLYACLACCLMIILCVIILDTTFFFLNKKADRGELILESAEDDSQPSFRYTL
ncbi:related to putative tartrate transporter [Cephalotrichum gorgonifer]|uniref:Related to putative tartrate transporter n=1 Tax=Cephalotrichum gorgonifer TaxID=2041049 RepID=A0AAE8MVV2_9PEZI|nr:related to putative tartrate transporter [Cephalotrichum gorgonifer]